MPQFLPSTVALVVPKARPVIGEAKARGASLLASVFGIVDMGFTLGSQVPVRLHPCRPSGRNQ